MHGRWIRGRSIMGTFMGGGLEVGQQLVLTFIGFIRSRVKNRYHLIAFRVI